MPSASGHVVRGLDFKDKFPNKCLGEIFFDILGTGNSDHVLVVDTSSKLEKTRADLLEATTKLAQYLKDKYVDTGAVIAIISPNSWKFLATIISATYLGCTITVSNPNYLHDDLNHFLTITAPKVLFVTSQVYKTVKELLPNHGSLNLIIVYDSDIHGDMVSFDDILNQDRHEETSIFMPKKVDPETTLSFIVFSSGTTGLPKGVIHTQNGFKHSLNVVSHPQNGAMNENDTVLMVLPLFHIFGLIMAIGAMVNNAKVLFLEKFKPDVFLNIIQKYRATYLPVVPTLLQFLSKSKIVEEYDLSSLRDIFCGGAPVGEETEQLIAKRWVALGPNKIGEICIRGPSVMKGYYKNEEATKKDLDQDGFLHTGDLGYYDEEMYFYVLDRIKEVIKYKGFQVPPAQLENILFQHPGVKEVAVVGKPDERAGELPTAFVLVARHLHSEKQLHGGVIFVEEIPKTQSGKIARAELRTKQLASVLRGFGLKKNDMIGIVSPSSWKYAVCILANAYLGVTVAGTNPNYLKEVLHLHPYVEKVIIMDSELREQNVFSFNSLMKEQEEAESMEIAEADDDDAVFILFSSGTTGFPKAVPFSQKALKITIQLSNTILANGKVILMEAFKPDLFLQSIEKYKVTFLPLVPSLMVFMVKSPKVNDYDISSVNDVFCGGSPIGVDLEELFYKRVNNVRPRQGYGLTEAGLVSLMFPKLYKPGSAGKLTPTIELKIINPDTKTPLGFNQSGEICLRGPTIMKSYLNDEEATRKDIDSDMFLHTGDMGYITEDGHLYIEAAVVGKPDDRAGELPTAFVVKQENVTVTAQELVDLIAEHFHADKRLHGGVIFMEQIPKTVTGKIARKVLKEIVKQY
nr:unnamed protein product [Callosobruchus analis]